MKLDTELLYKVFVELNIDPEYFSLFEQRANKCFADLENYCPEPDNDEYVLEETLKWYHL